MCSGELGDCAQVLGASVAYQSVARRSWCWRAGRWRYEKLSDCSVLEVCWGRSNEVRMFDLPYFTRACVLPFPSIYSVAEYYLSWEGVGCRRWYTVNAERPWPGPHANSPGGRRSILVTGIYANNVMSRVSFLHKMVHRPREHMLWMSECRRLPMRRGWIKRWLGLSAISSRVPPGSWYQLGKILG